MSEAILKEIVSSIGRIDAGAITAATPLTGVLSGSLGRARLDAAVRARLAISNQAVYRVATFGELSAALGIGAASSTVEPPVSPASAAVPSAISSVQGLQLGIDVELVSAMPEASDYWEDEFYRKTFTPREIAYALLQPAPRSSFATMWCAKEAARKAIAAAAHADWQQLEVVHAEDGRPAMLLDGVPAGSLTLSHAGEIAVAAFASLAERPTPASAPPVAEMVAHHPARKGERVLVAALALLAFALSVAALAVALFHRG